jgi:hypothetical protein
MLTFTYAALGFRQQKDAPLQIAFVAFSNEVLTWAGIPRKSDELLTGYQRFRDPKRIDQEIVPFFQDSHNCSPTALIVALRREAGIGRCVLEPADVTPGQVAPMTLTVELDETALETDRVFEAALSYVNPRLAGEAPKREGGAASTATEGEADEDEDEEEPEGDEAAAEAETEEDIHLGTETLARMKELLDDRAQWTNPNFRRAIADYVKPAFLIDGQHRVTAAAKFGERGLPFIVCGLFGPAWEEQVFQFTVVNLKPKRIPPALIASIAGLSLTRQEQDRVETRLVQAGVRMTEVMVMSLVAYDERSPFVDAIDMAVGGPQERDELLGYGGMKRIAKVWFRASRTSLAQIAREVFATNSVYKARNRWKTERIWFDFFVAFWSTVRDHFPAHLWQKVPDNRLFIGAHLWALQEVLLREADGQVPSHWKLPEALEGVEARSKVLIGKLLEVVTTTLAYFPAEMWTIEWDQTSQDTNAGREELRKVFQRFVDEGKKSGRIWKSWRKEFARET